MGAAGRPGRGRRHRSGVRGQAAGAAAVTGHLPGAGRAEPGGGSRAPSAAFADWWRTTAADRFTKIPASALDHRRFWDAMHAVPLDALPRIEEKLAAGGVRPVRAGHQLGGAGHDELRHVHRHRQYQGADRPARQGQAETRGPAAGRPRPGGHPGRRRPAAVPCLPREQARRHPVPADDPGPGRPARCPGRRGRAGRHRDDRGLRRRAELRGQLRAAGGHEPALRRVGARQ